MNQIDQIRNRARFLLEANKYKSAIEEAEKVLSYLPEDIAALEIIANSYYNMKNFKQTENYAVRILENDPQSNYGHIIYAAALSSSGLSKLAVEHCEKCIKLNPNNAFNYYVLACCLKKLGLKKGRNKQYIMQAIDAMNKALSIDADKESYHTFLAGLYIENAQYELAAKECEIALSIYAEDDDSYVCYAISKIYSGRLKEAEELILQALRLDPDNSAAQKNYKQILKIKDKPKKYYKFLERHFFSDLRYSKDSKTFIILVNLFIDKKEYKSALRICIRYLNTFPKEIRVHKECADILYKAGALAEAQYYLKAVKKHNCNEKFISDEIGKDIKYISNEMHLHKIKELHKTKKYIIYAALVLLIEILLVIKESNVIINTHIGSTIFVITLIVSIAEIKILDDRGELL